MHIKIIFFLSLIFYSLVINAQKLIVYDEAKENIIEFKYNSYDSDQSMPNFFISELSKSQSKIRSFFKYNIKANSHSILEKDKNNYKLNIIIDSIIYNGDFDYQGFNFQKSCLPDKLYYNYDIYENNTNTIINRKIELSIFNPQIINIDTTFVDLTSLASFTIKNEKLTYHFDNSQIEIFHNSIKNIKQYYNDGKSCEEINKEIDKLNIDNIDKIQLESIDIKYIKKDFEKIKIMEYQSQLSLTETDPARIFLYYKSTKLRVDSFYNEYRYKLNVLDSLFYAQGIAYKSDSNYTESINYFQKSIDFSSEYIPSLYELALNEFKNNNLLECEKYLDKILSISKEHKQSNTLAKKNYTAMLDRGILLNSDDRFTESLEILENAKSFCNRNINIIQCDVKQEPAILQAKLGIYNSYISIAAASMRRGRFDMTEDYLTTATKYQKEFPQAITNNQGANNLYNLLITQYLRLSIESASKYNMKKAKQYITKAEYIATTHSLNDAVSFINETQSKINNRDYTNAVVVNESIRNNSLIDNHEFSTAEIDIISPEQAAKNNYNKAIEKGKAYILYRRYERAYPEFDLAIKLEKQYGFNSKDSLFVYKQKCAKHIIIKQLNKASLHAWASRFKSASNILSSSISQINENNLQNDSEITALIKQLKSDIKNKENSTYSKNFNKYMSKASKSRDFADYYSMNLYCDSAINIANRKKQIALDIEYPKSLIKKYEAEIKYQQLIKYTKQYCDNKDYNSAINYFKEINSQYSQTKYKVENFSLIKFANYANSKTVYNYAIEIAIKDKNSDLAFQLWNMALKNNISIGMDNAKSCMLLIGSNDIKSYPNGSKSALYNTRFGNNKEFKKYKKYYNKGIKL